MIVSWLKWKLIIRWKNQWSNIRVFKNISIGKYLWLLALIRDVFNALLIFFGTYFFLKYTVFNNFFSNETIRQQIVTSIISRFFSIIKENYEILWSLVFLIIILFSIISGVSSSKWKLQSQDQDWLIINLKLSKFKSDIFLYLESIVWDTKEFIFNYIPLMLALGIITGVDYLSLITLIFLTLGLYLVLTFLISVFHNQYILLQNYGESFVFRILSNISFRGVTVYIAFHLGKVISPWVKNFPLTSNNVDYKVYNDWVEEGTNVTFEIFKSISAIFSYSYMPYNVLSNILLEGLNYYSILKILLFFGLIILSILLVSIWGKGRKDTHHSFNRLGPIGSLLARVIPGPSYTQVLVKHFYRTEYLRYRFPTILGPPVFWLLWGGILGILQTMNSTENIYFLVLSFYLFFLTHFYVHSIFTELTGIFSLDGEGKQVITYLLTGKSLWEVFKYKFHLFIITSLPLFIVMDIVFFTINKMDIVISISTLLLHTVVFLFLSTLLFLPSIFRPHFHYSNIEQLDEYADKKIISDVIQFSTVGLIIPILMMPTAFLLVGALSKLEYLTLQWGGIGAILSIIYGGLLLIIANHLYKMSNFDRINL